MTSFYGTGLTKSDLAAISAKVDEVKQSAEQTTTAVEAVQTSMASIEELSQGLDTKIDSLQTNIEELGQNLDTKIGALQTNITEIIGTLGEMTTTLAAIQAKVEALTPAPAE